MTATVAQALISNRSSFQEHGKTGRNLTFDDERTWRFGYKAIAVAVASIAIGAFTNPDLLPSFVFAGSEQVWTLVRSASLALLGLACLWRPGYSTVPPYVLSLILLILVAAFSSLWSVESSASLVASLQLAAGVAVVALAYLALGMRTWKLLLSGSILACTLSLSTFWLDASAFDQAAHGLRGIFAQKNSLGRVGAFALILALLLPGIARSRKLILAVISILTLVFANSSTAWVTVSVALIAALLVRLAQTRPIDYYYAATGLILASAVALLTGAFNAIVDLLGKDSTFSGRTYIWSELIAFWGTRPFAGFGFGAFWIWREARAGGSIVPLGVSNAHNQFLESALALGLIGLLVVVGIFCCLLLIAIRAVKSGDHYAPVISAVVVALMVISISEASTFESRTVSLAATVLILLHREDGNVGSN